MNDSHFDRFNTRLQNMENTSELSGRARESADADLDAVLLRLNRVREMGGLYAHVELSSYTRARMGIAHASEYTGDVFVQELEAVSV